MSHSPAVSLTSIDRAHAHYLLTDAVRSLVIGRYVIPFDSLDLAEERRLIVASYTQFALEALLRLSGRGPIPERSLFSVVSTNTFEKQPVRREYQRGTIAAVDGRWQVKTTGNPCFDVLHSMSEANGLVVCRKSVVARRCRCLRACINGQLAFTDYAASLIGNFDL